MKKVIIENAKVAYLRRGNPSKPKLLMLHGIFTSSCYFSEIIEFLEDDYDMLIPDLPGFGLSERLKGETHRIGRYAEIVKSLCDHLKFKDSHIVGASLGALVGIVFTSRYPDYVNKLFLQAPPWHKEAINITWVEKSANFVSNHKSLVKVATKLKPIISHRMLRLIMKLFNKHYYKIDKRNGNIHFSFKTMDLEATKDTWHALREIDLSDEARKISGKEVLIVSGSNDGQVHPEIVEKLTDHMKNSAFILLKDENYTHSLFFDCPDLMGKMVSDFLSN